jgi:hypothetical protein
MLECHSSSAWLDLEQPQQQVLRTDEVMSPQLGGNPRLLEDRLARIGESIEHQIVPLDSE